MATGLIDTAANKTLKPLQPMGDPTLTGITGWAAGAGGPDSGAPTAGVFTGLVDDMPQPFTPTNVTGIPNPTPTAAPSTVPGSPTNVGGNINLGNPVTTLTGYNPTTRSITPSTDTVQGQVQGIIAKNSPLMQQARTSAAQTANKRGLVNSSMANQAGEMAVLNAALPIASADAGIYGDAANRNVDAANAAAQYSGTAQNTGALQLVQGNQALAQTAAQGEQARLTQAAGEAGSRQTQIALQTLRGTQAQDLADTEAAYKTLMQTNDSAGKLFQQQIDSINKILTSDLTVEAKQAAVDNINQQLKNGLGIIGAISNIPGLKDLLDFGPRLPATVGGAGTPAAPTPGTPVPSTPGTHVVNGQIVADEPYGQDD